ncbi:MAG: HypC/HybG/HupF family hydrogenase formation chaperone [Candidatus Thorarchaeota archaeon]|nr:HypC/HybG/HupF family hydrogenase formation chaperone [Candidatus Thorarchaeota archaeon]
MCLAVPGLVASLDGDFAEVDFGGVKKRVCVALLPDVREGEYVIVHTGYAIEKLRRDEAEKTLELFRQMAEMTDEPPSDNQD